MSDGTERYVADILEEFGIPRDRYGFFRSAQPGVTGSKRIHEFLNVPGSPFVQAIDIASEVG